jgi:hypothetical protein
MKIHLTLDGRVVPATLADTDAAHAFAAMLPLAITLHGLFGREKFGPLPGAMPPAEQRLQGYEVGDIVCWSAGPDLAILHAQDGQALSGGFHVLGRIDMGAEAFGARGPLDVRIELADDDEDEDDDEEGAAALPGGCAGYRGRKLSICAASAS